MIFHIADPIAFQQTIDSKAPIYKPASFDTDGFIHCSEASQVAGTLHRHFGGADKFVLLAIDADAERDHLRYEDLYKRGQQFPHIYRPLPVSSIIGHHHIVRNKLGLFDIPHDWMAGFIK